MNTQPLTTQERARAALKVYRAHRNVYDARDWEIERIYRAIAKGKRVISVNQAIVAGGVDDLGRPKLAIMRADQEWCRCEFFDSDKVVFTNMGRYRAAEWHFEIPWAGRPPRNPNASWSARARLPRIPPQYRPPAGKLPSYHILWEADWQDIPRDPMLLKRIGKDAWVVVAAWDLTDVELSVLRAHQTRA